MEMQEHRRWMARCIELARKGAGSVSPNPMVGSVIVRNGELIGNGYHERYGEPHAEVNAIRSVGDPELLKDATLYVNLEPCSHYGKTPPCSDLIVRMGIPRVVVGCLDPHEKVAGKGIARMRAAGVDVVTGVMEAESMELNEAFIKSHTLQQPFVTLKIAQTLDGRTAVASGESRWITSEESRREVHRLRAVTDAVLTTSRTAIADNAALTVRLCEGRNPMRVVLDRRLSLSPDHALCGAEASTLIVTSHAMLGTPRAAVFQDKGVMLEGVGLAGAGLDVRQVFSMLHDRYSVLSVMVECGGVLAGELVRQRLVDRLLCFIAPKLFGGDGLPSFGALGVTSPGDAVGLNFSEPRMFGPDLCVEGRFVWGDQA